MDLRRSMLEHSDDNARLRLTLEQLLQGALRRPASVTRVNRKPCPFSTVSSAEILSVSLSDGTEMSVFLKHLGPEEADHPDKQCRDREVRIYQEFFGNDDLPVVKYFGSRWNEQTQRREVFLEFVDDWILKYHELTHWFTAAQRLAQFHAHFAARAQTLQSCDFLLCLNEQYLSDWAARALQAVGHESAAMAHDLAAILDCYGDAIRLIARQPVTLVHNDLAPKNVLADRASSPARVCLVDWEMAGVGCGVLDLVHLKYGLGAEHDRRMCAAYCAELEGTGLLPADRHERARLFAACDLHKTLFRLAHLRQWGISRDAAANWVNEARQLLSCACDTPSETQVTASRSAEL